MSIPRIGEHATFQSLPSPLSPIINGFTPEATLKTLETPLAFNPPNLTTSPQFLSKPVLPSIEGPEAAWTQFFGGPGEDIGSDLIEVSTGGYAIVGYTDSFSADPDDYDVYVIRTNDGSPASQVWSKTWGGPGMDMGAAITECNNGDLAIVGFTTTESGTHDIYCIRIDADGNEVWNSTYGGTSNDYGYNILPLADGGFVIVGHTYSYSSNPGLASDIYLLHIDANGNLLWSTTYGGEETDEARDIIQTSSGGFAILGLTYDPQLETLVPTLIRVDENGNELWSETYPISLVGGFAKVIETADGGFVFTVNHWETDNTVQRAALVKTDGLGVQEWIQIYTEQIGLAYSLVQMSDGGYALLGEAYPTDILPNAWLLRTTSDGSLIWEKTYGGDGTQEAGYSLVVPQAGGFTFVGFKTGTEEPGMGSVDIWLVRILYDPMPQDTSPPVWDEPPTDQYVEWGDSLTYDLNATDDWGIDHWEISDTANFAINNQGVITNATLLELRTYELTVRVYDASDNSLEGSFNVIVQDTTDPTWDTTPTDQVEEIGLPISYDVDASDLSGIASYWINDTSRFSIDGSGIITNITFLVVDEYWVEVRAYDPCTNYAAVTFCFIVQDTTSPSWDAVPADQLNEVGSTFFYDVDASDLSGIASYWINDTSNFTIDGNGGISNSTSLSVGIYWLEVRAYDPYINYVATTFKVTVQDTVAPNWDESPTNQFLEFGLAFSYDVNASDLGGIGFYWVNDTTHFTIDIDGIMTNVITLTVGIYGIELRAYDPSNNYCTALIQVVVQDTTDPTWDEPSTNQYLELGDAFAYDLNASDSSGINLWWMNDTTYFTIDSAGLITNIGLIPVGIHALEVRAYDPYDRYCSTVFTITVEDTVNPNWTVTPTDQIVEFGDSFNYDLDASDIAGISSYWVNDTSYFIVGGSGVISTISTLPVGTYGLEVRAYDPSNNYCQAFIQVTVEDTTAPTWDTTPTDQVLMAGESLDYQLSASDLSGIHQWTINDTTHFSISSTGRITSHDPLNPGVYGILVIVSDLYENVQTATFTVTVMQPAPPGIPGFPIEAIVVGLLITLSLGVLIRKRRRK